MKLQFCLESNKEITDKIEEDLGPVLYSKTQNLQVCQNSSYLYCKVQETEFFNMMQAIFELAPEKGC